MVKMTEYLGEMVPEELCTIGQVGDADDFVGCGNCFDGCGDGGTNCGKCVVNKIFQEYAALTGQTGGDEENNE